MEIEEHFYTDDPGVGHPDVRTRLPDTDYFFLGNGHIQAAVQVSRSDEGTPVGLLVMDPERFGPKRTALTCTEEAGLRGTILELRLGEELYRPGPVDLAASWETREGAPCVRATWRAGPLKVTERFYCPDLETPRVHRWVEVTAQEEGGWRDSSELYLRVGGAGERASRPGGDGVARALLIHEILGPPGGSMVEARWITEPEGGEGGPRAGAYWNALAECHTTDPDLDHLFQAARNQLPTAVDRYGRMDGSIWQYNLEWVRDQAHVAEALVRLGDTGKARTILARLLDDFVSLEGDTVDSGTRRDPEDVELDQNGELLAALGTFVDWTGELELVRSRWDKVRALATFPLGEDFRHRPSGLLHNRREYWERHRVHGIQDGFELMSQFFVALGLRRAADLAESLGEAEDAARWGEASARLKAALLEDSRWRLVGERHLIKRRGVDGAWQRTIEVESAEGLPPGVPLMEPGPHWLDPDASAALPIAHGFIDPRGELAAGTLAHLEVLWSQGWEGGGYGRYHMSGEPDSPGAWPFPSLFIARACVEAGEDEKVWRILRWLRSTSGGRAGAWFENHGPRISPPYPQVGIPPWTWAEMITLFVHHLLGVRPDPEGVTLRPRLLEGLGGMEASVSVRNCRLRLAVKPLGGREEQGAWVSQGQTREWQPWGDEGVRLPLLEGELTVEIHC
jgi:hypothetical protein